ncbi:phosphotransferase [Metabacillus sp. FJAT-53654]|uniref:Phosphotransferase n=1 Tax=Metabacillus rhizosphaerae TaxID=3117747 RepID=A0ABZ2MSF9_9BACI
MEVRYAINDNVLIRNLNKHYGIKVESIAFIPMGDSAYSYYVNCNNGDRYYLKLFDHGNDRQRRSIERLTYYLPLTLQLYHQKLFQNITFPIKNQIGDLKTTLNEITLVMFNFIEGETLAEAYPFSEELLEEIAQSMAIIHRITHYINSSQILTETFDISFEKDLEKCISVLEGIITSDNNIIKTLREQVLLKKERIFFLLNYVRKLRELIIKDKKDMVLCHGDLWGGNIIRNSNGLYFIDWESALVAPPEFDLVGYIDKEFDVFFSSYKKYYGQDVTINFDLLRFYSYRHHLRNLTNWIMNILYRNTLEEQNENDLEMIVYHCMNRWDRIEPNVRTVEAIIKNH